MLHCVRFGSHLAKELCMKHSAILLRSVATLACLSVAGLAPAESLRVAVISQSANNWPLFVAEEKGYFQREGLQIEIVVRGDSGRQLDGLAQGTFLNPPLSLEAIAQGFPRLTTLAEHFPDFPATSGGARRDWAKANEATLVRYLRASISAIDWLLDPKNRDEALRIFKNRVQVDERHLQPSYDAFVRTGLVRGGKLSIEGTQQVLELMAESGQLKSPLLPPEKYADAKYLQKAAER